MTLNEFIKQWKDLNTRAKKSITVPPAEKDRYGFKKVGDVYEELEQGLVIFETTTLMNKYKDSHVAVTEKTLKPFIDFLHLRTSRVQGTPLDYYHPGSSQCMANVVSTQLLTLVTQQLGVQPDGCRQGGLAVCGLRQQELDRLRSNLGNYMLDIFYRMQKGSSHLSLPHPNFLILFMLEKIDKNEWRAFLQAANFEQLKSLFVPANKRSSDVTKMDMGVVNDVVEQAESLIDSDASKDEVVARLFCLLEIYKRERGLGHSYQTVTGSMVGGVSRDDRVAQANALQTYLVSDYSDMKLFRKNYSADVDLSTMGSGLFNKVAGKSVLQRLYAVTKTIKQHSPHAATSLTASR